MTSTEGKDAMENKNGGRRAPGDHGGVRMKVLNAVMMLAAILTFVVLIGITRGTITGYLDLREATERYIACQQDAITFQETSDYLTDESREFVVTGNATHAVNFMEEAEVTRRREKAIGDFLLDEPSYGYLTQALAYSNDLVEVECHAMRLAAQAHGVPLEALPQRVRDTALTDDELAMSAETARDIAIDMVFGDAYAEAKANIRENVAKSIEVLVEERRADQIATSDHLNGLLNRQFALICALMVMMFLIVACIHILVMRPIEHCVKSIHNQERMMAEGAYETRFLANSYNEMFDKNTRSTEALSYSATHDSLTGLYNRTAYDATCREIDESTICALIVDVDYFKSFNDNYGHDVGDEVLRRVAGELKASFRSDDIISRIGGDEFSVIMKNADSRIKDIVLNKVRTAAERLRDPGDGLPSITLSVGIAFGDRENPAGDIFKDADTALYRVKRQGRNGCAIY